MGTILLAGLPIIWAGHGITLVGWQFLAAFIVLIICYRSIRWKVVLP